MRTFAFRFFWFNANTCDEGPRTEVELEIEAPSWDAAIHQLRRRLSDYRGRFFEMFMVADEDGYYTIVEIKGSLPDGTLLITDKYRAEFLRPDGIAP